MNLKRYNTFGIDCEADEIKEYSSVDELLGIIREHNQDKPQQPVLHIGEGSNLLFLGDYHGLVLKSRIKTIEVLEENAEHVLVRVGAGWVMDDFIDYSLKHGWYGQENLSLIPGQVGASAVQNIGAYGAEASQTIRRVECIALADGMREEFSNEDCNYAYRYSIFKSPEIKGHYAVTHVTYELQKVFSPSLEYGGIRRALDSAGYDSSNPASFTANELRQVIIDIRRAKLPDPKVHGNAGSFFMNPVIGRVQYENLLTKFPDMPHYDVEDGAKVKVPAGWLIEHCGWKGRSLGRAAVHDRQALVLVNLGGATGQDILNLCEAVRGTVRDAYGIEINPEVNFI